MLDQLTYFQHYIERVKRLVGQEKTNHQLAKGLAIVVAGSNDLAITYYGQGAQWLIYDVNYFTSMMANSAASFVMVRNFTFASPILFFKKFIDLPQIKLNFGTTTIISFTTNFSFQSKKYIVDIYLIIKFY